jgi:hypothetical protein
MKWKNIKKAGLTTKEIAKRLNYSNANSFRNSTKYKLIMNLLDESLGIMHDNPGSFPKQLLELNKATEGLIIRRNMVQKKLDAYADS